MAWRPYENLIDGELDNRSPGKVTGWMRFFRQGKQPLRVTFDLAGDFHDDIRGMMIQFHNDHPSDRNQALGREGTYMEGFARVQHGEVGDITAGRPSSLWTDSLSRDLIAQLEIGWDESGITEEEREAKRQEIAAEHRKHIEARDFYYSYVHYPYIEWYSDNGRVVLELDSSQVEVIDGWRELLRQEKTPKELVEDRKKRLNAFGGFMLEMLQRYSKKKEPKLGGEGNITGVMV